MTATLDALNAEEVALGGSPTTSVLNLAVSGEHRTGIGTWLRRVDESTPVQISTRVCPSSIRAPLSGARTRRFSPIRAPSRHPRGLPISCSRITASFSRCTLLQDPFRRPRNGGGSLCRVLVSCSSHGDLVLVRSVVTGVREQRERNAVEPSQVELVTVSLARLYSADTFVVSTATFSADKLTLNRLGANSGLGPPVFSHFTASSREDGAAPSSELGVNWRRTLSRYPGVRGCADSK